MSHEFKSLDAILDEIRQNHQQEEYFIYGHTLKNKHLKKLIKAMEQSSFEKFSLIACRIDASADIFLEFLHAIGRDLTELSLNSCVIMHDVLYCTLIDWVNKNDKIQSLDLGSMGLHPTHIEYLMEALCYHPSLRTLILFNNLISPNASQIALMLSKNSCLTSLALNNTELTLNALAQLVEGLLKNQTLKSLNIGINKLNKFSMPFLLKIINKSNLSHLDLTGNRLDIKEINTLADALNDNLSITSIRLERNKLHTDKENVDEITNKLQKIVERNIVLANQLEDNDFRCELKSTPSPIRSGKNC